MFELIGAAKRRKTNYVQLGDIKPPTGKVGGLDQSPQTFRFQWPAFTGYYTISYLELVDRNGRKLTPGVDFTVQAEAVYSSAYSADKVYVDDSSYWCSPYTSTPYWFQVTITDPAVKLDYLVLKATSYTTVTPKVYRLDGSVWTELKTFNMPAYAVNIRYSMYFGDQNGETSISAEYVEGVNLFNGALRSPVGLSSGTPGAGVNTAYWYLEGLPATPPASYGLWGSWINEYVCGGSNLPAAILQALPETRLFTDLAGSRILLELNANVMRPSYTAFSRNGINGAAYGPYAGSICKSIIYYDPKFGWYVRANPWEMTLKAFNPKTEIPPWQ